MIVPPIAVMPLVPVTAERFVMADTILFLVPFLSRLVIWRFVCARLTLVRRIVSSHVPLRIHVSPDVSLRVNRGQGSVLTFQALPCTHRGQAAQFLLTGRRIELNRLLIASVRGSLRL
jgi:hypothetical protein